jgi:hypothetical protein
MAISPNQRNLEAQTIADKLEKEIDKSIKHTQKETIYIGISLLPEIETEKVFKILKTKYLEAGWKYFSIISDRDGASLVLSELEKPFGDVSASFPNH